MPPGLPAGFGWPQRFAGKRRWADSWTISHCLLGYQSFSSPENLSCPIEARPGEVMRFFARAEDIFFRGYAEVMDIRQVEQQQAERDAARVRRAIVAASDFKAVIDTPQGRRFVRRLLGECGVHQSSMHTDALTMAYKEGRRSLGLWLQALFADLPDQYLKMLMEKNPDDDSE
jgi:hypothetical protein